MATGTPAKPKENKPIFIRDKKHFLCDMVKSDGQLYFYEERVCTTYRYHLFQEAIAKTCCSKEMITMQELARDAWGARWGFMNKEHILKIYEEQATELNLPPNFMIDNRRKKTFEREYSGKPLVESCAVPTLSSGMVGWRSSDRRCSLEVVGPLYVSPTLTIDPPRRSSDLPLHQTYIHLG